MWNLSSPQFTVLFFFLVSFLVVSVPSHVHDAESRRAAGIALESCAVAAIHQQVFNSMKEKHQAQDFALQVFLGQLLGGQYSINGTSPNMQVQVGWPWLPLANPTMFA